MRFRIFSGPYLGAAGGAGGAVQSIVAGFSWVSAHQHRGGSLGRSPADTLALAGSAAALPGSDGSVLLYHTVGHCTPQGAARRRAARTMGARVAWRKDQPDDAIVGATAVHRCDDAGLCVFLLLPDCGSGLLLHPRLAPFSTMFYRPLHGLWTGIHWLYGVACWRTASVSGIYPTPGRRLAQSSGQTNPGRFQQPGGCVPEHPRCGFALPAGL